MSYDFNELGKRYQALAAARPGGFGMLSPEPAALLEALRALQAREFRGADASQQANVLDAAGCLDRLEGFLFQLSRISGHARSLRSWPQSPAPVPAPEPGMMLVLSADEACYDFEGLLFQARAALDRLTWYVAARYGQRCNRFSRLAGVLANFIKSDPRAETTSRILAQVEFDGVLVDAEGSKALRSIVAHYSSVAEGRQIAFTIHLIDKDRRLIFDCEALGRPLLATAERLGVEVPFIVLNVVAVYSGLAAVALERFTSTWSNPSVSFTDYRDDASALKFTVANMLPDGFSVSTYPLRREVLDSAIKSL